MIIYIYIYIYTQLHTHTYICIHNYIYLYIINNNNNKDNLFFHNEKIGRVGPLRIMPPMYTPAYKNIYIHTLLLRLHMSMLIYNFFYKAETEKIKIQPHLRLHNNYIHILFLHVSQIT